MILENKLHITSQIELSKVEEKISKQKAKQLWLDLILKENIKQVIDWNLVDKDEYLSAMERSVIKDIEIKYLLKQALTTEINDRTLFMKGIDVSYYYEGYSEYNTEEV
ncbi:MAG: cell filamentation protein Fic [Cetobacterium sp.]|uniref:cell filamentation protein Fic n=1 Tax=Cetobacterium sp. TaxID=2071632 RepID=UPI003F40FF53